MTVAVDRQTSSLVVSSSEALFSKVQEMVKQSDEAAKKSNRTIRVVQLKNSDASVIQQSLSSCFLGSPQVRPDRRLPVRITPVPATITTVSSRRRSRQLRIRFSR